VTLKIFREILTEPELADWPDVGIAIQAYLRCTIDDVGVMIEWAKQRPAPVTVRLVRGAYWDYETVVAKQQRWPIPVWTDKAATDVNYETCLDMLMGAHPHIETAAGTHNVRSLALTMALAERYGLSPDQYEVQMLYGMADEIKARLVEMGQRLRVYVPFGELIPGMAYLVRRLLENTASQSFARLGAEADVNVEQVLMKPQPKNEMPIMPPEDGFANEPPRRFTDSAEREAFAGAIESVRGQLGGYYPLIIGGREHRTPRELRSIDASDPKRLIGTTADAGTGDADLAVDAAAFAFAAWRDTPAPQRSAILRKAASMMRDRRDTLAAWEVFEANKPWHEADADVTEAIDFVEYYAREAERLDAGHTFDVPGETNRYFYEPRGVGAVIAPWNFPLAIAVGMSIGPIAVGNTVVLKPAPQTPIIAAQFVKLMHEAGLPAGVLNFLPGGDEAGKVLVAHRMVSFVNFTGSLAAGCAIMQRAAQLDVGQHHLKHVVAELGGKNAIIIDSDADLDDAVKGVVGSAFSYAGQKCSAASRVIVVGDHYETFVQRLVEAAGSLKIGPATDPATVVPPVIDAEAYERIRRMIDDAKVHARCVLDPDPPEVSSLGEGCWIGPTIFADVDPQSDLAQQEVFGPVLAVMKADDFDAALRLANGVRYALTGGVYSRSPAHLQQAARQFRVGNLYLNRNITGAIVARQPFGGFKLSGTDAKAGGPDYLMQFVQARTVTENTLRRGFAPDQME
jgi:RHH-type proline utilization regulon transcriptional repressor/proline dehydrogenase/delta 1-pyrroline-5-carboxylate dehydrogenase